MALFTRTPPLDPHLESVATGFKDEYRKSSLKYVAKRQAAIHDALNPGETVRLVGVHSAGLRSHLVVITDQRVMEFAGSALSKQYPQGDVAGTATMEIDALMFVMIETETAQMDFMPDDPKRADHIVFAPAATPRQQQAISEALGR